MKIAIVGSGISGITCAYHLSNSGHDVHLFEANSYLGGHTATVDVDMGDEVQAIDTGFIVFNNRTYPNFLRFLDMLEVKKQETEMSFSVKNELIGLEYNGNTINTLFAQRKNIVNVKFLQLIYEILKFNRLGRQRLAEGTVAPQLTLEHLIDEHQFNQLFVENYLLPMGAAIWSTSIDNMLSFPADFFLSFFENHGLLNVNNRPQWYTIPGGSREYIRRFMAVFKGQYYLDCPIQSISRELSQVKLFTGSGNPLTFDQVILATHSDQALSLLNTPTQQEHEILSAIPYKENEVVLHTDTSLLPVNKRAWASWNYNLYDLKHQKSTVTYNMNILQRVESKHTYCVTLNSSEKINPEKIVGRHHYAHPQFTKESIAAQKRKHEISNTNRTHYCGAYWHNGFHEDGVKSALDVCNDIGQC